MYKYYELRPYILYLLKCDFIFNLDSMILLGSVPRIELIKMIDRQVGKERRMQVVAKWQREAQEKLDEMERKRRENNKDRRPSRFEVTPAPDMLQRKHSISSQSLSTNSMFKVLQHIIVKKKTNSKENYRKINVH